MKPAKIIVIMFWLYSLSAGAATDTLKLPAFFDGLVFEKTTLHAGKKILGKPVREWSGASFANMGSWCIHYFFTYCDYPNGYTVSFGSSRRSFKNIRRKLNTVYIDSTSDATINNVIRIGVSDSLMLKNIFGLPVDRWTDQHNKLFLEFHLNFRGQPVEAEFLIGSNGIINELRLSYLRE
jgi:hypothetical protein